MWIITHVKLPEWFEFLDSFNKVDEKVLYKPAEENNHYLFSWMNDLMANDFQINNKGGFALSI